MKPFYIKVIRLLKTRLKLVIYSVCIFSAWLSIKCYGFDHLTCFGLTRALKKNITLCSSWQEYDVGSAADCKEPLCCRNNSGSPNLSRRKAGHWGTYGKCDLPLWTVENLLENAAKAGPWDWVYWTGDIPAHNVWSQTREQQLSELTVISRLIHK